MTTIEILQGIKNWITTKLSKVVSVTAQTFTDAEKKQARANLGLGNGDIDNEPAGESDNLVTSGGVYNSTPTVANSSAESDLDISDEQGNVLVRFEGGHIQTKNFNSLKTLKYIII